MSRHRFTVLIGLVISVLLLWWALRDVSISELLGHLRDANVWLLLVATAVATFTFVLRAMRWRVLLKPAIEDVGFRSRFSTTCIGFMANNLLPARLGEFARAYSLSRIEPVGMSAAFASLVVERLFDALVLALFLVPALMLGVGDGSGPLSVLQIFVFFGTIVAAGLVTLGVLVRYPSVFLRLAERWSHKLMPRRSADRVTGIVASFIAGLGALRHAHVFFKAFAWSLVVWLWNALSFYLGFRAFGIEGPGIAGALLLQSMIGFAVSIPSSPGFFGPFEAAARVALSIYGIDPARTIGFAAGYHILSFFPVTVMGIWYMHRLGITRDELGHSEELVEAAVVGEPVELEPESGRSGDEGEAEAEGSA